MPSRIPLLVEGASSLAGPIDALFWVITLVAAFFTALIFVAIFVLAIRYRRGAKVDRSNPPTHNNMVEIVWTVVPLVIAVGIFVWAAALFLNIHRMRKASMEVYVVGKQWMWKLQHPEGRWEMNELHVPVGQTVQLTMTSEDVIHAFYVPEFRLKQDVIPGQYTKLWFTPTKTGVFKLFCAEFCGTDHSRMVGTVTVMEPAEYDRWLRSSNYPQTLAASGQKLFIKFGCNGCHGANSSVRAPLLEGIYGKTVPVQIPKPGTPLDRVQATTVIADSSYIHDSIVLPDKVVAAGYKPIMPSFKGQIREDEIMQIIAYIETMGGRENRETARQERTTTQLTPDEYQARVGFKPKNIRQITTAGGAQPGGAQPGGATGAVGGAGATPNSEPAIGGGGNQGVERTTR